MYKICGGDFTKFADAKKMKAGDAGILLIMKEKENFMSWHIHKVSSES